MALTRPRIGQLNTNVFADADPITVLHAGATAANVDVGFLMNRANGLVSNVALYWNEAGNTFVTAFTSNSGATDTNVSVTSYASITTGNVVTQGGIYTTTGLFWAGNNNVISTGGGGSAPAGITGQVQYNNGSALGASTLYYWSGNNVITTTSAVTAGSIQGTPIGNTTTSSGAFTSLSATSFKTTQNTVTIGTSAGLSSQGTAAVAVGLYAGYNTQGAYSVAIGNQAGQNTVGQYSVLAGYNAGFNSTSANVVSIGPYAGYQSAATNSVAIGNQAGYYQTASGIVINATGNRLNGNVAGFVVAPVRNDTGNISLQVAYNTTTNEFTYSNTISVASAIVDGTLTVSGAIVPNANATVNLGSTSAYWNNLYAATAYHNSITVGAQGITPTTGNSANLGSTTNWFNNIYGTAIHALYADLAENYTADAEYNPGTVVVFGGDKEITVTTTSHDTRVAGVISTDPAYLMNGATVGLPVAMTGRVPCQVQGPVTKGQVLVTSATAGVAEAIDNTRFLPGCIVGKALEAININTIETIEVVVGRF